MKKLSFFHTPFLHRKSSLKRRSLRRFSFVLLWQNQIFHVVGIKGESFLASIGKGYPFRIFALLRCGASVENCLLGSVPNPRNGKECEPMNGRKRTVQIKFRVTEEERAFIEQKMQLVPTRNMEAYLRKMAIDGYIIQIDHADIKAMTAEIQKIGVNVNQIAKRVNATGSVYQEDIEEIKEVLAEIWRLQRLSLLKAR